MISLRRDSTEYPRRLFLLFSPPVQTQRQQLTNLGIPGSPSRKEHGLSTYTPFPSSSHPESSSPGLREAPIQSVYSLIGSTATGPASRPSGGHSAAKRPALEAERGASERLRSGERRPAVCDGRCAESRVESQQSEVGTLKLRGQRRESSFRCEIFVNTSVDSFWWPGKQTVRRG